jgi:hypothetical protein
MSTGNLTEKQRAFADFYIIHKNATQAARLAGYAGDDNVLARVGWENVRKPKIRAYIDRAFRERAMSRDEVLDRLSSIAAGDAGDYLRVDEHDSRIVQMDIGKLVNSGKGYLIKRLSQGKRGTTVEFYSAHEALRDLAKFHHLFGEQQQVSVTVKIVALLREGRIKPEQVKTRWPNLADQLFAEAGISVHSDRPAE